MEKRCLLGEEIIGSRLQNLLSNAQNLKQMLKKNWLAMNLYPVITAGIDDGRIGHSLVNCNNSSLRMSCTGSVKGLMHFRMSNALKIF